MISPKIDRQTVAQASATLHKLIREHKLAREGKGVSPLPAMAKRILERAKARETSLS